MREQQGSVALAGTEEHQQRPPVADRSTCSLPRFQSFVVKYFRGLTDDFMAQNQPTARKTKCQNKTLFSTFFSVKNSSYVVVFILLVRNVELDCSAEGCADVHLNLQLLSNLAPVSLTAASVALGLGVCFIDS